MLRDLIKEKHDEAENHRFVKLLFSGNISKEIYTEFLCNQYIIYTALEALAEKAELLQDIEEIKRSQKIAQDLYELCGLEPQKIMPSTLAYVDYLTFDALTKENVMAHIYVRHMGDMFGGQMIKKLIPGLGNMYNFENKSELIQKVRDKLNDNMAEEANKVFDYAIGLFEDIAREHNIS
jgi:heme oxygenase